MAEPIPTFEAVEPAYVPPAAVEPIQPIAPPAAVEPIQPIAPPPPPVVAPVVPQVPEKPRLRDRILDKIPGLNRFN
ncbi:DUF7157 domain-containing protein [Mycolicibacterium chitae]|uniref:DUF7157 domain-containing protein n=1 Tax=Mycolicibacterium chitae TaxID=1792 RepID=UPI003F493AED